MDMNASYNLLVEQYLPQATIVYDRYHMQAQFGNAVLGATRLEAVKAHRKQADQLTTQAACETQDETRKVLKAQAKEEKRISSLLKKSRCTLLKNSKQLKDSEQQAKAGWLNWFVAAKASGIPALVKFAQLKEKRLPGLVAHATIPISTGKLEEFNNVIKTAKRTAYGYLNNEFFLRLIRYLSLSKG